MWPFNFEEENTISVNDPSLDPNNISNVDCMFDGLEFLTPMRGAFPDEILKSVDESYKVLDTALDESLNKKSK